MDVTAFLRDGFALFDGEMLDRQRCAEIADSVSTDGNNSQRHLVDHPSVRELLGSSALVQAVNSLLGHGAFACKATLFDKGPMVNWLVAWHQDLSIPVSKRVERAGWRGWSVKDGVQYVQPPNTVLDGMLAVRIHLDDCDVCNGPLRVLAGSHLTGRMSTASLERAPTLYTEHVVVGAAGTAVFMRPLLVHASSKAQTSARRRVLHLEFAAAALAGGIDWHRRVAI